MRNLTTCFLLLLFILIPIVSSSQSLDEGIQMFETGEKEKAQTFFQNHLKSNKKDPEANFYMGRIYFDEDDYGKAIDWFEKAAKYDKNNSRYHMWLGHSFGRRAQNAPKLKQPFLARNSRKNYEKAVELDPDNIEARKSAMEFYLQAPGFMGGGRDNAEREARAIMERDSVAGHTAWGRVYSYFEETEKAKENYKEAIRNHPEDMTAYYRLFALYYNQEHFSDALEIANQQHLQNDTTAAIYINKAHAQLMLDSFDAALNSYLIALEKDSTVYTVWYHIGRLAAVSGSYLEKGSFYIQEFLKKQDTYSDNTLAWAHFRYGKILEHQGNKDEAVENYRIALKKNKDLEEVKKALAELQ